MQINKKTNELAGSLLGELHSLSNHLSDTLIEQAARYLQRSSGQSPQLWETANLIGNYFNKNEVDEETLAALKNMINRIREVQGEAAEQSQDATTVVFGTSGWRGVIGRDFTLLNVHKVVRGIIEMMKTDTFLRETGLKDFDEVRQSGILLLRDNRFMGERFCRAARHELAAGNIKIYDAGECPTGVGSAVLTELKAAGSINFTPSHNPMEYTGIKFNPADGGPADVHLTKIIEEKANAYMRAGVSFTPSSASYQQLLNKVNAAQMFRDFVEQKSPVFDMPRLRSWLSDNRNDLFILVDNMHGASRGYIQALLGPEVMDELTRAGAIRFIHTDEDFSFHGVKPEPGAANQEPLIEALRQSGRKFTLAVALDPDADRIRFADARMDMDMNRFAPVAYANLLARGLEGGIASTAPSSDFALEIAKRKGQKVWETAVGFKHFRQALKSGEALLAFEESDGISFRGHTLEKCALAGFLAAIDAIAFQNKNLSEQYEALRQRYGYFYPDKAGAEVQGVGVEEWQAYKKAVVHVLQKQLFKEGDNIHIGGQEKKIARINTIDGLKLIFDDKSWILLRPSGTEPKFRYYYEVVSDEPIENVQSLLAEYRIAAQAILTKARELV